MLRNNYFFTNLSALENFPCRNRLYPVPLPQLNSPATTSLCINPGVEWLGGKDVATTYMKHYPTLAKCSH